MTALDEFDRLEAVAVLKRSADDPGQEVVVTLGEATLTMNKLSNKGEQPISHWSLAAVDLLEDGEDFTAYMLDAEAQDRLIVEDRTFRRALGRVISDRQVPPSAPKSRRGLILAASVLAACIAAYWFLPGLIRQTAVAMISPERAEILAADMLPMIEARAGPACETAPGRIALDALSERLNPAGATKLSVHDLGDVNVISLPGDLVLLNANALNDATDSGAIAAWAALGIAGVVDSPAISQLFGNGGILDGFRFLSSGELPDTAKSRAVNHMLLNETVAGADLLSNAKQLLDNAGFQSDPLGSFIASGGQAAIPVDPDPMDADALSALRNICN